MFGCRVGKIRMKSGGATISVIPGGMTPEKRMATVADNDHNRNKREGQGPAIGTKAWTCNCGCFAFYITATATHCYECHTVQRF